VKTTNLLLLGLLVVGLSFFAVGCEDDPASPDEIPELSVSVGTLDFGGSQTEMTFNISNSGTGVLNWTLTDDADWLSITPASGANTAGETDQVTATVDRTGLAENSYDATITVSFDDGDDVTVAVTMAVAPPTMSVSTDSLDFGTDDTTATFTINNLGSGTVTWTVASDMDWLTVSPDAGSTTSETDVVTLNADRAAVNPGVNTGTITITSDVGDGTINVWLTSGSLIWSYSVTDQADFTSKWDAFDDDGDSGDDFWGVSTGSGMNGGNAVWCAAQGEHADGQYDNDMESWMRTWTNNAIDISNYSSVTISFWMKYETEDGSDNDMVGLYIYGTDDTFHSYLGSRWTDSNFEWNQYHIALTEFDAYPSASLQFAFRFVTDVSVTAQGAYIEDIQIWGDAN